MIETWLLLLWTVFADGETVTRVQAYETLADCQFGRHLRLTDARVFPRAVSECVLVAVPEASLRSEGADADPDLVARMAGVGREWDCGSCERGGGYIEWTTGESAR